MSSTRSKIGKTERKRRQNDSKNRLGQRQHDSKIDLARGNTIEDRKDGTQETSTRFENRLGWRQHDLGLERLSVAKIITEQSEGKVEQNENITE